MPINLQVNEFKIKMHIYGTNRQKNLLTAQTNQTTDLLMI